MFTSWDWNHIENRLLNHFNLPHFYGFKYNWVLVVLNVEWQMYQQRHLIFAVVTPISNEKRCPNLSLLCWSNQQVDLDDVPITWSILLQVWTPNTCKEPVLRIRKEVRPFRWRRNRGADVWECRSKSSARPFFAASIVCRHL